MTDPEMPEDVDVPSPEETSARDSAYAEKDARPVSGLAVAEAAIPGLRYVTGTYDPEATRERAQHFAETNPVGYHATTIGSDLAIALAGGAVASAASKAAGLGGLGTRLAVGAVEGGLGGGLGEAERAFVSDDTFSVGNMLMYGLGGEVLGAAAGTLARRGANLLARSEARAAGVAVEEAVASRAPRALADNADDVLKRVAKDYDAAVEPLARKLDDVRAPAPKERAPIAPVQTEWAHGVSREAILAAPELPEAVRARVLDLADDLAPITSDVRPGAFRPLDDVAEDLARALPPDHPLVPRIREGLQDEALWGPEVATSRKDFASAVARARAEDPREVVAGLQDLGKLTGDETFTKGATRAADALDLGEATRTARARYELRDTITEALAAPLAGAAAYQIDPSLGVAVAAGGRYYRVLRRITEGAQGTIAKAARAMATGVERGAAPLLASSLTRFSADYPSPEAAYAARRDVLRRIETDPTALASAMASSLGDLPNEHPEIYTQMAARVATGVQYLHAHLPASIVRNIKHPGGLPPSRSDIALFSSVYEAVTEPAATVERLGNGTVRPEAMQALAAVHPDIFAELQYQAVKAISAAPGSIPTQTKIRLDLLLGLDGAATPAFSSATAASARIGVEKRANGGGGQRGGGAPGGVSAPAQVAALGRGPTLGGAP